jgi:hypothetical protein
LYRLSIDQYERMAEAGVVSKDDRIELIDGLLVQKMVKLPPHVVCAKKTFRELECLAPTDWHVAKEDPIRLPDRSSDPEPDLTGMAVPEPVSHCFHVTYAETRTNNLRVSLDAVS